MYKDASYADPGRLVLTGCTDAEAMAWGFEVGLRRFAGPVVERSAGGRAGGGAALTALGREVVLRYRRVEAAAARSARREFARLARPPARRVARA